MAAMIFDLGQRRDERRWRRFEELVARHGGTILDRMGDRVKVRMEDEVLILAYTGDAS